jgi:type IV secretion system protein VirB10
MASGTPPASPAQPTERDPRPIVRRPRAGLPGAAIAGIAAVLALSLFLFLNGRRQHPPQAGGVPMVSAFPAAPALTVPPEPVPPPPMVPTIMTNALPAPAPVYHAPNLPPVSAPLPPSLAPVTIPKPQHITSGQESAPALVLDTGTESAGTGSAPGTPGATGGQAAGEDAPVRATLIRNRTTVMPTGTVIPAVLETPIDSARPGLVRAIVSEDTRGFDGKRVLVPRGSRLIGEYQSDVRSGQNRVLVTWTRLLRPDGVAIRIGSPAADALGGAGVPGHVNSFFFRRFASAVLQSALTVGVNLASRPGNGSVIVGLPTNTVGTIGQDLIPGSDLKPKIKVKQGAVLDVFVAHDLDFSGTPSWGHGEAPNGR